MSAGLPEPDHLEARLQPPSRRQGVEASVHAESGSDSADEIQAAWGSSI